jgi:hypothetical protein
MYNAMYNAKKGGVDVNDQIRTGNLAVEMGHRVDKWNVKAALGLFNLCVNNAYLAHRYNNKDSPNPVEHTVFTIRVATALIHNDFLETGTRSSRVSEEPVLDAPGIMIPYGHCIKMYAPGSRGSINSVDDGDARRKVRECANCVSTKTGPPKRVQTSYYCPECDKGLCPTCFLPFHDFIAMKK